MRLFFLTLAIIAASHPVAHCAPPILKITAPGLLQEIEKNGASFGELIESPEAAGLSNAQLFSLPFYKSIATSLAADLDVRKSDDSKLSVTMSKSHRLFNKKWFWSKSVATIL